MILIPVGLIAWLAIRLIRKIPNKTLRIVCYVILFIIAGFVWTYLEDNGWEFCYKGGCFNS